MAEFNFPRPHTDEAIKNLEELEELELKRRDYEIRRIELLSRLELATLKDLFTTFKSLAGQRFMIRFTDTKTLGPRIMHIHSIVDQNIQIPSERTVAGFIAKPFSNTFSSDIEDIKKLEAQYYFRITDVKYFLKKEKYSDFEEKHQQFCLISSYYEKDRMDIGLLDLVLLVVPKEKWSLMGGDVSSLENRSRKLSVFLGNEQVLPELERMKASGETAGLPW